MYCEVILLRLNRKRLRPDAWPAPVFGRVEVSVWEEGQTSMTRPCNVATLRYKHGNTMEPVALVLLEPKVELLPLDAMVWSGREIKNSNLGPVELEQAWLVRIRSPDAPPLQPFDWARWMAARKASTPGPPRTDQREPTAARPGRP